jgi:hypothetical protein
MDLFNVFMFSAFLLMVIVVFLRVRRFYGLPTLKQYLRDNPNCRTQRGPKCCHCGSRSISRSYEGNGLMSKLYRHACRSCGETLYRTSV